MSASSIGGAPDAAPGRWPPRGLTGWLVRRATAPGARPDSTESRTRLGEMEGYVSGLLSIALAAVKVTLGWMSGSLSLMADAVNNATDIASSAMIAFACRWSRKPRDREHPFGHGRAETIATLTLSFCLLLVAVEVAKAGIRRLGGAAVLTAPDWMIAAVAVTLAVKGWLAGFARRLARAARSEVLEADAWNHGFDILSTALVLVALAGARLGQPRLDAYAGLGVSVFIGWTGWKYARRAVHTLIGTAPDAEDMRRIRALAHRVPGVRGVHDLIIHAYGDLKLVSLHIEVDANLTVMAAHEMAERVEAEIAAEMDYRTVAHVDPVDRGHPAYDAAETALRTLANAHAELADFHDLRLRGPAERYDLSVDLVARGGVSSARFAALLEELKHEIHGRLPGADHIDLGLEMELASEHEHRRVFRR
jgi:cation diffusion facilitator family transporter